MVPQGWAHGTSPDHETFFWHGLYKRNNTQNVILSLHIQVKCHFVINLRHIPAKKSGKSSWYTL